MLAALAALAVAVAPSVGPAGVAVAPSAGVPVDVRTFQVVKQSSGPVDYYRVQQGDGGLFLRAQYVWPLETVALGAEAPLRYRKGIKGLRWRWRVHAFPEGADDCREDVGDAPAGVFATFRAGLKVFVLKYVWNSTGTTDRSCELANWLFFAKRVVVLRSGGGVDTWQTEEVDPRGDFARLFGVPLDEVPDFVGVGILTDGDATRSRSEADYADFVLLGP